MFRIIVLFLVLVALVRCSAPNSGPLAGQVASSPDVDIVNVSPELSFEMAKSEQVLAEQNLYQTLDDLSTPRLSGDHVLGIGDTVQVDIWTFSPWPSQTQDLSTNAPSEIQLGTYQINAEGAIALPYVGIIRLAGLTDFEASNVVSSQYSRLGILHDPQVTVRSSSAGSDAILVTGAIGDPKLLPWNPSGMTAAEAITLALGNGSTNLSQENLSDTSQAATKVTIIRHGRPDSLPIEIALTRRIALQPGDELVVSREPIVTATILGGGVTRSGSYSFATIPTLTQAIATAQGLNPDTANSTRVFVLRQDHSTKPKLYVFDWTLGSGLVAAQEFTLKNNDVVYVAESPIVPVSRVLNMIFQLALPASLVR